VIFSLCVLPVLGTASFPVTSSVGLLVIQVWVTLGEYIFLCALFIQF
jgi:hypothetical protein